MCALTSVASADTFVCVCVWLKRLVSPLLLRITQLKGNIKDGCYM